MSDEIIIPENRKSIIDDISKEKILDNNDAATEAWFKKQELKKQGVVNIDEYDIYTAMKERNIDFEIKENE